MEPIIGYAWYNLLTYRPVMVHPIEQLEGSKPLMNSIVTGYPAGFV